MAPSSETLGRRSRQHSTSATPPSHQVSRCLFLLLSCGLPWRSAGTEFSSAWREEAIRRAAGQVVTADDYDTVSVAASPAPPAAGPLLHVLPELRGTIPSTGRPYVAHVCRVDDPLASFSVEPPLPRRCGVRRKTSSTASARGCLYATNGGFFDMGSGQCLGSVVSDGRTVQLQEAGYVSLGLVAMEEEENEKELVQPKAGSWVVGSVTTTTLQELRLRQLIQGIGWLVREGRPYVVESMGDGANSTFVTEKAPRTAAGLLCNGSLVLVQVDGQEDVAEGLDLMELSEMMGMLGEGLGAAVWQAVNLDGGGSSVSWWGGEVVSRPTCLDNDVVCERAVTTIMCVRGAGQRSRIAR